MAVVKNHNSWWHYFPWITAFLACLIWTIHIFVSLVEDPAIFRKSYGITPGDYRTYITYGFIHVDLVHIVENTVGLLIFGSAVELQVRRLAYTAIIAMSILVGAVCVVVFPYPVAPIFQEGVVGFSAAGWALKVIGLGVLIRLWGWSKGLFWIVSFLLVLYGFQEIVSISSGEVTPGTGALVTALVVLAICFVTYAWLRNRPILCGLIPVTVMIFPLIGLLHAQGINPGEVGHLAGGLVGALILFPILQNKVATDRTTWAVGGVNRLRLASGKVAIVIQRNWDRRIFPAAFYLLLTTVVLMYIQHHWG